MNLFDKLVDEALTHQHHLAPLRNVVEKELLHHDILRILSHLDLLTHLTFIGGTCLRTCYGSHRLSEDLDFTGGIDFDREILANMGTGLIKELNTKYGLHVEVSEPVREIGNVDTWKLKIQTRSGRRDLPIQRINIDICAIPSYQAKPMLLRNPYGVDMGTSGLIIQSETREEIFADKIIAFALRPNRIKQRDLWDIVWLTQQNIQLPFELIPKKLNDHRTEQSIFLQKFDERRGLVLNDTSVKLAFQEEMRRFLPLQVVSQTINQSNFWSYLTILIDDLYKQISHFNIRQR